MLQTKLCGCFSSSSSQDPEFKSKLQGLFFRGLGSYVSFHNMRGCVVWRPEACF